MARVTSETRNPLLWEEIDDPLVERVLSGPSEELAEATRPSFLNNPLSPLMWGDAAWDGLQANQFDIFDMKAIRTAFDAERFLIDGYAVFEAVMTPRARDLWVEAADAGQQINDALIQSDWRLIDWEGLGRTAPEEMLTKEAIDGAIGGSQKVPQSDDSAGVLTLRNHGVFAEYFPAGHMPFLMDVLTHPQMLALQRMCLGAEEIYFDHNQLLTRPPGYVGGGWHSHKIGGGYDDVGMTDPESYRRQPNTNLTICYPDGFEAEDDAGLKIIRGSHLFRDPVGCRSPDDDTMVRGWLEGKMHPVTGEPLVIDHLSLSPGSIVCCLSHGAHGVSPKAPDRSTRWSTLYCYKKADYETGLVLPSHAIPPAWSIKAHRGMLPESLTELFRASFDQQLTQGRTGPHDT